MNVCFKNTYMTKNIYNITVNNENILVVTVQGLSSGQFEYIEFSFDELVKMNQVMLKSMVKHDEKTSPKPIETNKNPGL